MTITPYLYFNGNCAAAFDFYQSVFGGDFTAREPYSKLPAEYGAKPEDADKLMHVTLEAKDFMLMGADMAGDFGPAPEANGAIALSLSPSSREEADKLYHALSANGGTSTMAMQETFWGSYFGTCTDRFGISWMINFNQSGQP